MLTTIIAPELLVSKSLEDLLVTKENFEIMTRMAREDEVPWSRTHVLFANMGGFVIRCNAGERIGPVAKVVPEPSDQITSPRTITDSQEETHDVEIKSTTTSIKRSNPYHLVASDIVALRRAGLLTRLPYVTMAELNDKNKSDNLVRFIAVVQILWMIVQIIVRASRHLAISQLEIGVVAFATCATIIYGLNWQKPKGVQAPITILQYRGDIPENVLQTVGKDYGVEISVISVVILFLTFGYISTGDGKDPGSPISNVSITMKGSTSDDAVLPRLLGLSMPGMVFGAIHMAAWNFVFPTLIERKIWWAASVFCTAVPLTFFGIVSLLYILNQGDTAPRVVLLLIIALPLVLYIVARLFLIVEIFRTLCFLPPSAYIATWATNVPHMA
jgi:hypothetical protein